jgi:metal-responsive CopG/Arc/MetJ family transcriptional regulator
MKKEKTKQTTSIHIDRALYAECKRVAEDEGKSCSDVISEALDKYLSRKPRFRFRKI